MITLSLSMLSLPGLADQRGSEPISEMLIAQLEAAKVALDAASLSHALASNPDSLVRIAAAEVLGIHKESFARPVLLKSLKADPDRLVRETVALALARLGAPEGISALKGFLHDSPDPARQLFLAARLAELGVADGYQRLSDLADSRDERTRALVAESMLPFLAFKEARDKQGRTPAGLFLALAKDESVEVRRAVALRLQGAAAEGLDPRQARSALQQLAAGDPDASVREEAGELLKSWPPETDGKPRSEGGQL